MKVTKKISLYYNTLRHLKIVQFTHRLKQKVFKPQAFSGETPQYRDFKCKFNWLQSLLLFTSPDEFTFLNDTRKLSFPEGWNNSSYPKLWLYNLHYFDWLRQTDLKVEDAERTISRWIYDNPAGKGNGWEPYTLSLRIVNWIKWHLAGNKLSQEALDSLASQTHFLSRKLEYHLLANHLLANAKALIFAGVFFEGTQAAKWFETGLNIYSEQLPEQILADGGHFELSPMYHSIILEDLLDVYNLSRKCSLDFSALNLDERILQMFDWLYCMTHLDGRISLFNDSALNIAHDFEKLKQYAGDLDISLPEFKCRNVMLKDSGYGCLKHGDFKLIADVGRVGPDYQPGHAHADTLSFELSYGKQRLIVDSGTSCYGLNPIRIRERSTASHNTISLDGKNSSEVWSAHRVAKRAEVFNVNFDSKENMSILSASHDGYNRIAKGLIHKRQWNINNEKIIITDTVETKKSVSLDFFLHFSPEIRIENQGGNSYILNFAGDNEKKIMLNIDSALQCEIKSYEYGHEFGKATSAKMITGKTSTKRTLSINTTIEKI